MKKDQLKRMAGDPKLIAGIYNYCDRWCERCPFASRCLNHAMGREEDKLDPKSRDPDNKEFWERIAESLQVAMELIVESAAEHGIDLNEIELEEQDEETPHDKAEKHPAAQSATTYASAVDKWMEENEKTFEGKRAELEKLARLELPGSDPVGSARDIAEAVEIIRWYQYFIGAKIVRALSGKIRGEDIAERHGFPKDSDGSAKIALIALDRSIAAWAAMMKTFPEQEESVLALLVQLERLRRSMESEFPDARRFQRPGFDEQPKPASRRRKSSAKKKG